MPIIAESAVKTQKNFHCRKNSNSKFLQYRGFFFNDFAYVCLFLALSYKLAKKKSLLSLLLTKPWPHNIWTNGKSRLRTYCDVKSWKKSSHCFQVYLNTIHVNILLFGPKVPLDSFFFCISLLFSASLLRHPTSIFGKISVRKTIWDLELSEYFL